LKKVRTTCPDEGATRHFGLGDRHFVAETPNQLWVTDLTFVPTWTGVAYVCFIIDAYSRMIFGWRCASSMRTQTVFDALEMARFSRGTTLEELVCHSDAGSRTGSRPCATVKGSANSARSLHRIGRRQPRQRQRPRRSGHRPLPDRSDPPAGPLEVRRRHKARHPFLGHLVQHHPAPRHLRCHPPTEYGDGHYRRQPKDQPAGWNSMKRLRYTRTGSVSQSAGILRRSAQVLETPWGPPEALRLEVSEAVRHSEQSGRNRSQSLEQQRHERSRPGRRLLELLGGLLQELHDGLLNP
jgi:hypothetical protein